MQFRVPQFIDVEDKIFGPFTFKQFAYLAGGAGLIFIIYKFMGLILGIIFIIPVGVLTFLLVFYKINNRPFIYYLQAGIQYLFSNRLYIWKQRIAKPEAKKADGEFSPIITQIVPMTTSSKLKDIAWSLDVQKNEQGDDEINNLIK